MLALLVLLSQKQDPSRNKSYNLIKRCKCVEYFWWIENSLAWSIFLLYLFLDMGYLFSLFFWHALWACGIPSLGMHLLHIFLTCYFKHVAYLLWVCIFYLFLHSPCLWWILWRKWSRSMEFYLLWICGWKYIAIFQCRSIAWWCMCSWSWEYNKFLTWL